MFLSQTLVAQNLEGSIEAFNALTKGDYVISNKGRTLIVDGFREGNHVKTNKVNVFDLDLESFKYSEVDNSVSVKCYSEMEGCVTSVLTRERSKKSYRNRLVFSVPDKKNAGVITDALRTIIVDMSEKY